LWVTRLHSRGRKRSKFRNRSDLSPISKQNGIKLFLIISTHLAASPHCIRDSNNCSTGDDSIVMISTTDIV
jgi:hypothetical protein